LAERRSAATFAILEQLDFESERFEHSDRRNTDVRLVVAHKCVVPKNNAASSIAAVCDRRIIRPTLIERRYSAFFKPAIEPFACVMRQRTLCRNTERFFHQRADRFKISNCICESRRRAAESAEQINRAKD